MAVIVSAGRAKQVMIQLPPARQLDPGLAEPEPGRLDDGLLTQIAPASRPGWGSGHTAVSKITAFTAIPLPYFYVRDAIRH
jgi:hypothetical protein